MIRIINKFLPDFDELQFFTALASIIAICIVDVNFVANYLNAASKEVSLYFLIPIVVYLTYLMFNKNKLEDDAKVLSCFLYSIFLSLLAYNGANSYEISAKSTNFINSINFLIIVLMFMVNALRALLLVFILKLNIPRINTMISINFIDSQYNKLAFVITMVNTLVIILFLSIFYDSNVTLLTLGYSYSSFLNILLKRSHFLRIFPK